MIVAAQIEIPQLGPDPELEVFASLEKVVAEPRVKAPACVIPILIGVGKIVPENPAGGSSQSRSASKAAQGEPPFLGRVNGRWCFWFRRRQRRWLILIGFDVRLRGLGRG